MPARKPEQEKEVLDWIQAVLGEPVPDGEFEEVFWAINYFWYKTIWLSRLSTSIDMLSFYPLGSQKWSGFM